MKNRTNIGIIASIIRCAANQWEYQTTIMNKASVSHSQITRYLRLAVKQGLMEYSKVTGLYKTTSMGADFLEKHDKLAGLFPEISEQSNYATIQQHNSISTKL